MKIIYLIIISFITIPVNSQTDSLRNVKTADFDIFIVRETAVNNTVNKHTITYSGLSVLQDVKYINYFADSTISLRSDASAYKVNINKIKSVKFYIGSEFLRGLLYGGITGFTIVTLTALLDPEFKEPGWAPFYGLVAAIPTAFIGGILGAAISKSYEYDFSNLSFERRKSKLIRLIRQYKYADEM